jgi:hypothetical protein
MVMRTYLTRTEEDVNQSISLALSAKVKNPLELKKNTVTIQWLDAA